VDSVSTGTTGGAILTIPYNVSGPDRLMLVAVSIYNDNFEFVSDVAFRGLPLTHVRSDSNSDDARVEIWRMIDPPAVSDDVVITFSANLKRYAVAAVITFSGVDSTNPLGSLASASGTSKSASVDILSSPGELILGVLSCKACSSVTFIAPAEELWNVSAGRGKEFGAGSTVEGTGSLIDISASLGRRNSWTLTAISIRSAP
jgi:hypothetical protein